MITNKTSQELVEVSAGKPNVVTTADFKLVTANGIRREQWPTHGHDFTNAAVKLFGKHLEAGWRRCQRGLTFDKCRPKPIILYHEFRRKYIRNRKKTSDIEREYEAINNDPTASVEMRSLASNRTKDLDRRVEHDFKQLQAQETIDMKEYKDRSPYLWVLAEQMSSVVLPLIMANVTEYQEMVARHDPIELLLEVMMHTSHKEANGAENEVYLAYMAERPNRHRTALEFLIQYQLRLATANNCGFPIAEVTKKTHFDECLLYDLLKGRYKSTEEKVVAKRRREKAFTHDKLFKLILEEEEDLVKHDPTALDRLAERNAGKINAIAMNDNSDRVLVKREVYPSRPILKAPQATVTFPATEAPRNGQNKVRNNRAGINRNRNHQTGNNNNNNRSFDQPQPAYHQNQYRGGNKGRDYSQERQSRSNGNHGHGFKGHENKGNSDRNNNSNRGRNDHRRDNSLSR